MTETHSPRGIWASTVENLTLKFFPGISFSQLSNNIVYGSEAVASLPLEMVLYFSALFFPCWLAASLVMLTVKFQYVSSLYQWILVAIHTALPLIEVMRLYIGNIGNTEEKVPELAGSWLLTLLLQVPLLCFILLIPGTHPLPLDYAVNGIFLVFLVLHLVFGYMAVTSMASHHTRLHHLYLVMGQTGEGDARLGMKKQMGTSTVEDINSLEIKVEEDFHYSREIDRNESCNYA